MDVNVHQPWEIGRSIGFYQMASQGAKLNQWEDLYPLAIDRIRGKRTKKEKAFLRESTKEEQAEFLRITNSG